MRSPQELLQNEQDLRTITGAVFRYRGQAVERPSEVPKRWRTKSTARNAKRKARITGRCGYSPTRPKSKENENQPPKGRNQSLKDDREAENEGTTGPRIKMSASRVGKNKGGRTEREREEVSKEWMDTARV